MKMNRAKRSQQAKVDDSRLPVSGLTRVSEEVIYPHIFRNADREVGGVLVGRGDEHSSIPLVTGAIPAISADEQRSTLTFTQDSWEHVHRVLEEEFPEGDQIVGWYHSHPGFGIFLSGHDLFIHNNFFTAPFQIAVVVDPLGCTDGTFVWENGEVTKLYEYPTPENWSATVVPPEARTLIEPDSTEPAPQRDQIKPSRGKIFTLLLIVGLFVSVALAFAIKGGDETQTISPSELNPVSTPAASTVPQIDRDSAKELLEQGVERAEESGDEAVAAVWLSSWDKPVIVGDLKNDNLPAWSRLDSQTPERWTPEKAIASAHANGYAPITQLGPARVGDPFAYWPARINEVGATLAKDGSTIAMTIGGVPGQMAFYGAVRRAADDESKAGESTPESVGGQILVAPLFTSFDSALRQLTPPAAGHTGQSGQTGQTGQSGQSGASGGPTQDSGSAPAATTPQSS